MTQPAAPTGIPLADGFPPLGLADWQALAAVVVNKRRPVGEHLTPVEAQESLRASLDGGITLDPLYLRPAVDPALGMPGRMPFTRGRVLRETHLPWDVRALHDDPDVALSRAAVLDDLEHGVTSVWVHVGEDGIAAADLAEVLADVRLDLAPVVVSSTTDQPGAAAALLDVLGGGVLAGVNLGHDPIGAAARRGSAPDLPHLAAEVKACAGRDGVRAITVDTRALHDAGSDDVDEIAYAVATGVAYLRHLEGEGITPAEAFAHVEFRISATADQFLTAARLRALRRVWARVGEVSGVPETERGARTHAVTSLRMTSREDPWVNLLRDTLAAFGASLGGADAITVLPYDTALGLPERFSRRLARNTQVLLCEESNVGRVSDPAGGSWYVEALTDDVARSAWATVQDLERGGGMVSALASGQVHERVAAAAAERDRGLATRSRALTGISTFPILDQPALERRPRATLTTADGAMAPHRDAAAYEALRERARALGEPGVVVRPLGVQRDFAARAAFVANLLAAGGIRAVEEGSPVAVLASSRKGYAAHAADAVADLRACGVAQVWVAGRAAELGEHADLVDGEVFDGTDVIAFLGGVLDALESGAGGEQ